MDQKKASMDLSTPERSRAGGGTLYPLPYQTWDQERLGVSVFENKEVEL
jgi:hypothetical protein